MKMTVSLCFVMLLTSVSTFTVILKGTVPERLNFPMERMTGNTLVGDGYYNIYNTFTKLEKGPKLVNGIKGKALRLNGSQSVEMEDVPCFTDLSKCTDGYTLSMWLRLDRSNFEDSNRLFFFISSAGSNGVKNGGIDIYMRRRVLHIAVRVRELRKTWFAKVENADPDVWYPLVVTWHPQHHLRIYVYAIIDTLTGVSDYVPTTPSTPARMTLGKRASYSRSKSYGAVSIDELKYWNRILSPSEIGAIYRSECKTHKECLITTYKLKDAGLTDKQMCELQAMQFFCCKKCAPKPNKECKRTGEPCDYVNSCCEDVGIRNPFATPHCQNGRCQPGKAY